MTHVPPGTRVLGSATVVADDPGEHARNKPSFYADPAAWLVAETVDRALADCAEHVRDDADDTAILVVSATGSERTMRRIADSVPRSRSRPCASPAPTRGAGRAARPAPRAARAVAPLAGHLDAAAPWPAR
ncbi:polyketide synthase [Streptomyces albulus]|nr:polyketide synthase [Streptomyces noursei]